MITTLCETFEISRSWYYYKPVDLTALCEEEFERIKLISAEYYEHPFYGYRKIAVALKDYGLTFKITRRLMKKMGLRAIYPGFKTTIANKMHQKYPYLLRNKQILASNHVWATDITYINLNGSYVYLAAIVDIYSRKVLSWRLSNTMETSFCVEVLEEALRKYGIPAIFNTDQGSQFTSDRFVEVLKKKDIQISMDGKGRALDNIFVERLWRSLKYEEIYLNSYSGMVELKEAIDKYFNFFNLERFHQSLEYATPDEIYYGAFSVKKVA
jgi:Transposase and inactivated derivatives